MTVAVNTTTENIRTGTGSPTTFSHAGAASGVKGVLVALVNNGSATDSVTAVSYGGVALTRLVRATDDAGEAGSAQWWFLGSGVPQGTQTVSYTTGAVGDDFQAVCITLTGSGDLACIQAKGTGNNIANPSETLAVQGRTSMGFCAYFSGLSATTNITDGSGITRLQDHDFGQQVAVVARQTTASASDFTFSFTAAADDVAMATVAITDALVSQDTWRWRNDDGSESAATWVAAAGADATVSVSSNTKRRLRFALSNAGVANNVQPVLERAYNVTVGWDVSAMSDSGTAATRTSATGGGGVGYVSPDGLHAYYPTPNSGPVYEYSMSTAWDLTTLSYVRNLTVSGTGGYVGVTFKPDGTKMFVTSYSGVVLQYTLSTAWDISTASAGTSLDIGADVANLYGSCGFSDNGTYLYVTDSTFITRQWELSTAWDVATASNTGRQYVNAQSANAGIVWRPGGTAFYLFTTAGGVYQYSCAVPWMIDSATYASKSFSSTEIIYGGTFNADGTKFISTDSGGGQFRLFNLTANESYWEWEAVTTTTTKARAADSTNVTHAGDTTQQITSGTFISPNSGISETGTAGTDNDLDFTAGSKSEVEYVIEFVSGDLSDAETLRFRIRNADVRVEV